MMCNCSLAGTAACRTCSMNDQFREKNINKISESLTQEAWLKLLKAWADGSMTVNRTKTDNKLNTFDLYYGTEFFIRITAEKYQYDETRDRFCFMKDGTKFANVTGYDLNIIKIDLSKESKTQEEIAEYYRQNGIDVDQTTISRKIKQMKEESP